MQLFYYPDLKPNSQQAILPKDESKHIIKVLRQKNGDSLDLTDGSGHFYKAIVTDANPNRCAIRIDEVIAEKSLPYTLHLAVAPTKLNDRFETFLEKATEIGISEITPIICEHSERKVIKPERYERILQSAMKQSLKAYLPKLNEAISIKGFIEKSEKISGQKFIAHCDEEGTRFSLKQKLMSKMDILILIGPEGDFSSEEIDFARAKGFAPVTLGDSRLRTETAAIVAVHSVAFINSP